MKEVSNICSQRIGWIDTLKGITILFVVLGHVLLGYYENHIFNLDINLKIYCVKTWIYTWHMPVFFTISGFTFSKAYIMRYNSRLTIKKPKLKRQILNLLCIYFIFQTVLCITKFLLSEYVDNKLSFMETIKNIFFPDTIMWYLWVLVIAYFIFAIVINNLQDSWYKIGILFLEILIFQKITAIKIEWCFCVAWLAKILVFFWIGISLERKDKLYKILFSVKIVRLAFLYVLIYGVVSIFFFSYIEITLISNSIFEMLNSFSMVIVLIYFFSTSPKEYKLLQDIGRKSLVIYLLHTYVVTGLKVFFIRMGLCTGKLVLPILSITFLVPISITYAIALLSDKVVFLKWMFNPLGRK